MPTLFEKIIAGDLPATVLYRDPRVIAFLDIRPAAPVHILIVPNKVIPTANDIADEDESLIGHMFIVARDLARQQGIAESGYRLIINCNAHGGQEVYHCMCIFWAAGLSGPWWHEPNCENKRIRDEEEKGRASQITRCPEGADQKALGQRRQIQSRGQSAGDFASHSAQPAAP